MSLYKKITEGYVERKRDGTGVFKEGCTNRALNISRGEMRNVFDGDLVCVKKTRLTKRQALKVEVLQIKKRRTKKILGTFFENKGKNYLKPIGKGFGKKIEIQGAELPNISNGDVVLCKLKDGLLPEDLRLSVIEVWGAVDELGMESKVQIFKYDIKTEFPADVEKACESLGAHIIEEEIPKRRDLRELAFVTIDGDDAKDFDDAIHCSTLDDKFILRVAIADVSHFVAKDNAIDQIARERGTSIYFPRMVVPMLPTVLSDDLCSLRPFTSRLGLVCEMVIESNGLVKNSEFYLASIKSEARLTYKQANNFFLNSNNAGGLITPAIASNLKNLNTLFNYFNQARFERGALSFSSKETKYKFNENNKIAGLIHSDQFKSHRIIEECMLAANVCAAKLVGSFQNSTLSRVHGSPGDEKVVQLNRELRSLGVRLELDFNPTPLAYRNLLKEISLRENAPLIEQLVIKSLERAYYADSNMGHFGLAYDRYTHFTSPIRRYPDLICHRAIKAIICNSSIPKEDLVFLGSHLSERERLADSVSRDAGNWCAHIFMRDKLGQKFKGYVSSVREFGIFVTLVDYPVDGLVHISKLGRDYYYYDIDRCRIIGGSLGQKFQLGSPVKVRLVKVDIEMGEVDFVVDTD